MAILFTDGFGYNSTTNLSIKWDSTSGILIFYPDISTMTGYALQMSSPGGTASISKSFSSNQSTLVIGFRYIDTSTAASKTILRLYDGSTIQIYLDVNASRQLVLKNGDGTTLATSISTVRYGGESGDPTSYIELKVTFGSTTGSYTLKCNNYTEATATNVDTINSANSYANKFEILNTATSGAAVIFDDVYAESNDFLGMPRIYRISPSSDSSVAFTPSSGGSNYLMVDETGTHDGDSTYVYANVTGIKDLYGYGDLALTSGTVKGIVLNFIAKKLETYPISLTPIVKISSTEYTKTAQALSVTYDNYQTIWDTNPATSTNWTYAEIDALIVGYSSLVS